MDIVALIGRILFCIIFLNSARGHLTNVSMLAQYSASKRVPAPKLMVMVTGLMLLLGALSILLGLWVRVGAALLVIFLIPTAFIMHNFWTMSDPMARANDQAHFFKDLALAGAALMFFVYGTGALSIAP
jgi:putative oxidoreductase